MQSTRSNELETLKLQVSGVCERGPATPATWFHLSVKSRFYEYHRFSSNLSQARWFPSRQHFCLNFYLTTLRTDSGVKRKKKSVKIRGKWWKSNWRHLCNEMIFFFPEKKRLFCLLFFLHQHSTYYNVATVIFLRNENYFSFNFMTVRKKITITHSFHSQKANFTFHSFDWSLQNQKA